MEPVPDFFFWTVWSSEALAAGESASTPDPRGPDCVARAWRRLRSFGVAERSKRKARDGGAPGAAPLSVPRMLRHGRDVPRRSGNIGFPAGRKSSRGTPARPSRPLDSEGAQPIRPFSSASVQKTVSAWSRSNMSSSSSSSRFVPPSSYASAQYPASSGSLPWSM